MGSFRLGTVFGFEIRIDYSWFIIFFLILWSFTSAVFPASFPGFSGTTYILMGAAGTLLFFASLLAHELSHSLVARAKGIPVEGITLFIFGGMARTKTESETPGDEFQIAGVGPLSSLLIGAMFGAVWWFGEDVGLSVPVVAVAAYLGFLNVVLAVFNLLPGFPLDGGRLFRAVVWKVTGDLTKATRYASTGGRWLGYALIAWGLYRLFAGEAMAGLWLIFIGWFLRNAAAMGLKQHLMRDVFSSVLAREAMTPLPETVRPGLTLRELVDDYFLHRRFHAYPVTEGDETLGIVSLNQVKGIPQEEWSTTTVGRAMQPIADTAVVRPDDSIATVLEALQDAGERRVLVLDDGRLVGIISPHDLTAWLERVQKIKSLEDG